MVRVFLLSAVELSPMGGMWLALAIAGLLVVPALGKGVILLPLLMSLQKVSYTYPASKHPDLQDINLNCLWTVGSANCPSGSGKSTLSGLWAVGTAFLWRQIAGAD